MSTAPKTRPIEKLYDELDDSTGKLSTKAYTVVLGVLGLVWSSLQTDKGVLHALAIAHSGLLLLLGAGCFVALIADGLHYYFKVNRDTSTYRALPDDATEFSFDHSSGWDVAANVAVGTKMIASALLPIAFAALVIYAWFTMPQGQPKTPAVAAPT